MSTIWSHSLYWISRKPLEIGAWFQGPPIGNDLRGIKWSRGRWRHVTPKGETHDRQYTYNLVLSGEPALVSQLQVINSLGDSDHNMNLLFTWLVKFITIFYITTHSQTPIFCIMSTVCVKNPPWGVLTFFIFFTNGWEFLIDFLHTYYSSYPR